MDKQLLSPSLPCIISLSEPMSPPALVKNNERTAIKDIARSKSLLAQISSSDMDRSKASAVVIYVPTKQKQNCHHEIVVGNRIVIYHTTHPKASSDRLHIGTLDHTNAQVAHRRKWRRNLNCTCSCKQQASFPQKLRQDCAHHQS